MKKRIEHMVHAVVSGFIMFCTMAMLIAGIAYASSAPSVISQSNSISAYLNGIGIGETNRTYQVLSETEVFPLLEKSTPVINITKLH
jgi:hypothetical protein